MSDTLDTGDIASMLHLTREYVTDKLVRSPNFPKPVINRSQRLRRWKREAVEAWAAGVPQSLDAMSSEDAR